MNVTLGNNEASSPMAPQGQASAMNPSGLGQDDFLNLLITQLTNQNPLEPMEGADFVAQLATFTSVEQLMQANDGLETLALGQAGLISGQSVNLVGKSIKYPGNEVTLEPGGNVEAEYAIGQTAETVEVTIKDDQGRTVRTMEMGPVAVGTHDIEWDGLDDDGDDVPPGSYTINIQAKDSDGEVIPVETNSIGKISAVRFEQGVPFLMVGDIEVLASDIAEIRE